MSRHPVDGHVINNIVFFFHMLLHKLFIWEQALYCNLDAHFSCSEGIDNKTVLFWEQITIHEVEWSIIIIYNCEFSDVTSSSQSWSISRLCSTPSNIYTDDDLHEHKICFFRYFPQTYKNALYLISLFRSHLVKNQNHMSGNILP